LQHNPPVSDRNAAPHYVTLCANNDISHCGKPLAISAQLTDVRRGVPCCGEHRQAAKRAAADIEGHSATAEHAAG
jgi:hypothetical protein